MLTERDLQILAVLAEYYVLNRRQIQRLVFPQDTNGRVTRRRLQMLVAEKFIQRQKVLVVHDSETAAPVYFPAVKGNQVLFEHFSDERFLRTPTRAPISHHTLHWLAVSDTHIALRQATQNSQVRIDGWINEWDVVNKNESLPELHYRLYTLISAEPRLVCAPDAAFLLSSGEHRKVFYLEQDRATSGSRQIASAKTKGYAAMFEEGLHRRHFPETTLDQFSVLMVAPTPGRREALRQAFADKPGAPLWRFVAASDFQPERILTDPIFYVCDSDDPKPLLKTHVACPPP